MLSAALLTVALFAQVDTGVPPQKTEAQEAAEHKASVEQEYARLPKEAARPVRKIVSVSVEGGYLVVKPKLPTTGAPLAVQATDWPGLLELTAGDADRQAMNLKHIRFDDQNRATYTHIITVGDYVQISRDTELSGEAIESVSLLQTAASMDEPEPVRLNVSRPGDAPGEDVRLTLSARTFDELRQQHGAEMRRYALPLLKDLGADTMLRTSSSAAAWQVLGSEVPVDAAMTQQLDGLIARLESDDSSKRASAEDALTALGPPAAAALRQRDLNALPPDARAVVEAFVRSTYAFPPQQAKFSKTDVTFLLDTLLLDEPLLRAAALKQLSRVLNTEIKLSNSLTSEQRAAEVEALRGKHVTAPR